MNEDRTGESRWALAIYAALGVAQVAAYAAIAVAGAARADSLLILTLALFAFSLYLAALAPASRASQGAGLLTAALVGTASRATLLPSHPLLSDDYHRYLWDGLVQLAGLNPYEHAPADMRMSGIDEALRALVNHPTVPTIYPPLAQAGFAIAVLFGGLAGLKALWLACDLGIACLLYRMVPASRRLRALTTYWWSPLVIIEVAWNAHLDLLGVLPLVAALAIARPAPASRPGSGLRSPRARATALGAAIAAAALVKYFPAAVLPCAARRRRPGLVLAAFALTIALFYLPYLGAGSGLFAGLGTYAVSWRFNDGLFAVLVSLIPWTGVARVAVAALVLTVVVQSVRDRWPLERTAFWVTGSILVVSPTVHPWYLLWMVPLVALRPSRAWLYLSGSVLMAYYGLGEYWRTGHWPEPWWLRLVIWGPFFAVLILDWWRGSWWRTAWSVARTWPVRRTER